MGAGSNGVFELDKIVKIRFDENGTWTEWFDVNNGTFNIPQGWMWNAWDHVTIPEDETIVPEPGALSLLGLGVFGLAARRRRK